MQTLNIFIPEDIYFSLVSTNKILFTKFIPVILRDVLYIEHPLFLMFQHIIPDACSNQMWGGGRRILPELPRLMGSRRHTCRVC
jgi:hypothetical protein